LDRVEASFRSPRGRIVSNWRKEKGRFEWEVVIPANCRATLGIPLFRPGIRP
ncbi:protein containing Bacterial alpha-L-rhamnosidase domain protein, partial [human gut metagenome]